MDGWRAIVGDPDWPPSRMGVSIGDSLAATYGCTGALAALRHRAAPPRIGHDNDNVYTEVLGMSAGEIADLKARGVS
jgi:formyl-CoA transferase